MPANSRWDFNSGFKGLILPKSITQVYQAPSSLEVFQPNMSIDQHPLLRLITAPLLAEEHTHYIPVLLRLVTLRRFSVWALQIYLRFISKVGRVAQSVQRLATGWTVRGSNPDGGEIFRTCPDRPWGPPSLLYNGYRDFPGDKELPGRDGDPSSPSSTLLVLLLDGFLLNLIFQYFSKTVEKIQVSVKSGKKYGYIT